MPSPPHEFSSAPPALPATGFHSFPRHSRQRKLQDSEPACAVGQALFTALRKTSGSTRTYREIAREIGQPTAARAVAGACATNPAAVVILCHRVVREGGHLAGYRWGLGRKKALLALEQERQES